MRDFGIASGRSTTVSDGPNNDQTVWFGAGARIDEAMRRAVRRALARHKRLGQSVVVCRDGEVVCLSPEQIPDQVEEGSDGRGEGQGAGG
jgi:hypothetical protein